MKKLCIYLSLAMTNILIVIINSFKLSKFKKSLLYEMKFLVQNYSCLQIPLQVSYAPRSPFCLFSVLNWICWANRKKFWVRHWSWLQLFWLQWHLQAYFTCNMANITWISAIKLRPSSLTSIFLVKCDRSLSLMSKVKPSLILYVHISGLIF